MIRSWTCAGCGLDIVADDEAQTIAHRLPECEWFAEAIKQGGGSEGTLTVFDDAGRPIDRGTA